MIQPANPPAPSRPRSIPLPGARPVCTYGILAVTTLVFIGQQIWGYSFTRQYGLKINDLILQGEFWRLVTPIFFHANILHFFFNMYALYNVGLLIERPLGYSKFLIIYFFSGVAGVFASFLITPADSLGASGAIFGLIGALAVFLYRNYRLFGAPGRNLLYNVVFIIVINLLISVAPGTGIDLWGHVGGLVTGSALAWILAPVWMIQTDPYTGQSAAVDLNPFSRRTLPVFLFLLSACILTLWLVVR